ncbi:carotenoid isomerooxygenase-like [Mizuhopecten yessoensis]|uniref:Beta,beta-carotene 15,15'-monooxygenase n=1 Tax=Mizuhopecten yessoensis TaxID=6573 RepID=A0A210PVJ3_MIZYE|nr:carotenoid isomerooxygenase-like [Mizuhopecten yessoensis]OWF40494.1 Beta,beta-carotene 15,15'-monooxygenase [Mizuhopecten yessoensis]
MHLKMAFRFFLNFAIVVPILMSMSAPDFALDLEPGFDVFFKTNLDEMENVPIYFDKPIPKWLQGTLIRNGLGRFEVGHRNFTHSFDAFGKLSSWVFPGNGSAFFSTKYIQSEFYKESVDKNDIASYLMFESVVPKFNEFQKLEALARGIDNMNVNVYKFTDQDHDNISQYVVLNDFWKLYQIEPSSLTTMQSVTAAVPSGKHSGGFAFLSFLSSAHPLPESGTLNHFTFVSSVSIIPGIKSKISLIRVKSTTVREAVAEWDVDKVPYMHSFSVTPNYVIIFAAPFYVNVEKILRTAEPFDSLDWFDDQDTTVYVIHIKTGHVQTMTIQNVFTMHHINAFERNDSKIVVDISAYPSPAFVKNLEIAILRDVVKRNNFDAHAIVKRYVIDLENNNATMITFETNESNGIRCAHKLDMPTINENYRYKDYCFVYGVVLKWDDVRLSRIAIVKKDLCGQNRDRMWFVPNHYPTEAWFVPFPSYKAKNEDDGYLLVPVLDGTKKNTYLAFIDARTMTTTHRAYLPTPVPFSLHGRFFPELVDVPNKTKF